MAKYIKSDRVVDDAYLKSINKANEYANYDKKELIRSIMSIAGEISDECNDIIIDADNYANCGLNGFTEFELGNMLAFLERRKDEIHSVWSAFFEGEFYGRG